MRCPSIAFVTIVTLSAAIVTFPTELAAQATEGRPALSIAALELSIGGRVQTQFNTSNVDGVTPSQLLLRRARIEIGVQVNDWVSGVVQPEFGGNDVELKDTYVQLDFVPGLQLRAGKAYRPFGLMEMTSSKRILPVERGLRIRGLAAADAYALTSGLDYSDRDIGVQFLGAPDGAPMRLGWAAGIFRGPLHGEVGAQDSYQYAARVTVRPLDALRFGAGWSSRDFVTGIGDTPALDRGHAFELDVEYGGFAPGLHLLAEISGGDVDPLLDATFRGAQAWLAYRTRDLGGAVSAVEPVLRVSHATTAAQAAIRGGTLLTPGFNVYFGPLNRIMINYDIWNGEDNSPDARSFKAMLQMAF